MNTEERIIVVQPLYDTDFIHIVVSHISAYKFYIVRDTPITLIYLDSGERFEVEMSMEEFYQMISGNDADGAVTFEELNKIVNGDNDGIQR